MLTNTRLVCTRLVNTKLSDTRLKSRLLAAVLIVAVVAIAGLTRTSAQDSGPGKPASDARHAYRLDFSVNEIEDGKKINSRQYSMHVNAGEGEEVKIGTRVPFEQKQNDYTYIDVGTNIWCRLRDRHDIAWLTNDDVMLNVKSEVSNFAVPDQQGQTNVRPLLRQMKIEASTIAALGKPIVVGVVDDPNSKHQYQLEVTVTKLR